MANEARIRDNLAKSLDSLEPGLVLIQTEYPLPNRLGTRGFIDILARDGFGNRVIIEVKRSNATARQALHELFKYVALYRAKEGLAFGSIRCLLVATDWDELRVPFAEFLRVSECQCAGIELDVDSEGAILGARPHIPVPLVEPVTIFREHSLFLFEAESARDKAVGKVLRAFEDIGGKACLCINLDYIGPKKHVIYPWGSYFVPVLFDEETLPRVRVAVLEEYEHLAEEPEEVRRCVEEEINCRHLNKINKIWDSYEIGYPEKFESMIQLGWKINSIERMGNVLSESAADDDEILRMVAGSDGSNAIHFRKMTSPRFAVQWKEVQDNAKYSLIGNDAWTHGFDWFMDRTRTAFPGATVGIAIYNPLNLPMALYQLVQNDDGRFLPQLEVFAHDTHAKSFRCLLGRIEWDGTTQPSFEDVFGPKGKDLEGFMFAAHGGSQWQLDADLMHRHGMKYSLALAEENGSDFRIRELDVTAHGVVLRDEDLSQRTTLLHFVEANKGYVSDLVGWMNVNISIV